MSSIRPLVATKSRMCCCATGKSRRSAAGSVTRTGSVGYLPQDPRTGDPEVLAVHRILSARGLDDVVRRLREAERDRPTGSAQVFGDARRMPWFETVA